MPRRESALSGALFIAAVVNGVISPILIAAIIIVANDERILGRHKNNSLSNLLGSATVAIMGLAAFAMAVTYITG